MKKVSPMRNAAALLLTSGAAMLLAVRSGSVMAQLLAGLIVALVVMRLVLDAVWRAFGPLRAAAAVRCRAARFSRRARRRVGVVVAQLFTALIVALVMTGVRLDAAWQEIGPRRTVAFSGRSRHQVGGRHAR